MTTIIEAIDISTHVYTYDTCIMLAISYHEYYITGVITAFKLIITMFLRVPSIRCMLIVLGSTPNILPNDPLSCYFQTPKYQHICCQHSYTVHLVCNKI